MAHALSSRRSLAGDKTDYRFSHVRLHPLRGFFFRAPADLPDHDHTVSSRVSAEHFEHVDEFQSVHRIASDPYTRRLPESEPRQLIHGFVGQRPAPGNNTDVPDAVNMSGHDSDL